ncbi:WD repeat-containing protein 43 isoform X2 [Harpegnathos saltator]|uniref:WD repeat-containing protein 43 isoform X2 n=1 Tax=Harpegnathos saltator TaxID=610380 RepID=UPI00058E5D3D|nr:WD repeat-containing protein 43 isoform X2 [Harpegnathos saltator]
MKWRTEIWETANSRPKCEYIPNRHLSSPCSVIQWISVNLQSANNMFPSQWKKRKRKSISEDIDHKIVAIGLSDGNVALFNVSSTLVTILKNDNAAACTAITWSAASGLITASDDYHLMEWNIQDSRIKCKWKSGKMKVTALAVPVDGKSLLAAERTIKWWDLTTKQLIRTFTGHIDQVTSLHPVKIDDTTSYLISSSRSDNYLSVWAMDQHKNDKVSIATLLLHDEAVFVSTLVVEQLQIFVLATTKLGQAQLFKYQPNGRTKPLKPSLSITVTSNIIQENINEQIPIVAGHLTDDKKLLLAFGDRLMFEKVVPDFSAKVQCLVRSKKMKKRKEEEIIKMMRTEVEENCYFAVGDH